MDTGHYMNMLLDFLSFLQRKVLNNLEDLVLSEIFFLQNGTGKDSGFQQHLYQ